MLEFIIGLITGASALWLSSINKNRFTVFEQKITLYKEINKLASNLVMKEFGSNGKEDEGFLKSKLLLSDIANSNLVILPDNINESVGKLTSHSFNEIDNDPGNFLTDYSTLIVLMREDLNIAIINRISNLIYRPHKDEAYKKIIESINIKRSQILLKAEELATKQVKNR